jgi:hypothetical protein
MAFSGGGLGDRLRASLPDGPPNLYIEALSLAAKSALVRCRRIDRGLF